jgi:hypothetical protein
MIFLRLHKILAYLEATGESRCVVKGEEVLCANLLIVCGVTKVVETMYEHFNYIVVVVLKTQTTELSIDLSTP